MARRGNPYDNAMMEKWNGRLPPRSAGRAACKSSPTKSGVSVWLHRPGAIR